MWIINGDMMTV